MQTLMWSHTDKHRHIHSRSIKQVEINGNYYYYNRFMTLCPGLSRWVGTSRTNHSGFCWSSHDGVAVASAEPCASYLHFASEDNHASISSVKIFTGQMTFLTPNQQRQSTEGQGNKWENKQDSVILSTKDSYAAITSPLWEWYLTNYRVVQKNGYPT